MPRRFGYPTRLFELENSDIRRFFRQVALTPIDPARVKTTYIGRNYYFGCKKLLQLCSYWHGVRVGVGRTLVIEWPSMKLLIATTNAAKISEITNILSEQGLMGHDFEIMGLNALKDIVTDLGDVEETGSTFEENALIKARHYNSLSGIAAVADDSGLEVDALEGRPGVLSARYAGLNATDQDRVAKLLGEMKPVPKAKRGARFVCSAAFVGPNGEKVFTATAPGWILDAPRGVGGFGYDPVFFYEPLGKTFAELSTDEKSRVSHRGRAFSQLARWLTGQVR